MISLGTSIEAPNPVKVAAKQTANDAALKSLSKAMLENNELKVRAVVLENNLGPKQILSAGFNAATSTAINGAVPVIMLGSIFTMMNAAIGGPKNQNKQQ